MTRLELYLPIVVSILYLITGFAHFRKGQPALAWMWLFYASANIALAIHSMHLKT